MDLNSSSTQVVVTSQMKHTVTSNVMLGRISIDYSLNKPCLLSPWAKYYSKCWRCSGEQDVEGPSSHGTSIPGSGRDGRDRNKSINEYDGIT